MTTKETYVIQFNKVVELIISHIVDEYNDDKFKKLKFLFNTFISNSSKKPINMFLEKVYSNDEYRKNIIDQNEEFFMNNDFSNINDKDDLTHVFEFKELWKTVNVETKLFLKKSLFTLVKLCEKFLLI